MNNIAVIERREGSVIDFYEKGIKLSSTNGFQIVEMFLTTLNSNNTVTAYKKSVLDFYDYYYGIYSTNYLTLDMMVIDPSVANNYSNYWKEKLDNGEIKTSTYNCKIKGIRKFYDWLIIQTTKNTESNRLFNINPFKGVSQKSEDCDKEGSDPLDSKEVELMLNNPIGNNEHIQERNKLILEIGISTGIRNDAIITMKMTDIIRIGGEYVIITRDKGKKASNIALNEEYYERLVKWYEIDKKIRRDKGESIFNIHPSHANRIIKEWANSVGIDKRITFHSLRSTTAMMIYHNSDNNIYEVQMALRHSDEKTSAGYVQKGYKIIKTGKYLLKRASEIKKFDETLNNMSKEELIYLISNLSDNLKLSIIDSSK